MLGWMFKSSLLIDLIKARGGRGGEGVKRGWGGVGGVGGVGLGDGWVMVG